MTEWRQVTYAPRNGKIKIFSVFSPVAATVLEPSSSLPRPKPQPEQRLVRLPERFGSVRPLSVSGVSCYDYIMKMTDSSSPEAVALLAACTLHNKLLNDDAFLGYDGTKHQFDLLYSELFIVARDEVSLEVEPVEQVIETWYDYQYEIMNGERDVCWWM